MSAERALFDAYQKWHRLAKAGHKAICKRDWGFLHDCQNVVREIQPSIARLHEEVRREWKQSKTDYSSKEKKLRALISELKGLLESNQKLLHSVRSVMLAKREKLDQVGRNLRRLQTSYTSPRRSAWTSFS
jgi:chromosome segregation ATPase